MSWLEKLRSRAPREVETDEPETSTPAPVERRSPGLAALFALLKEDGRHSILDLGPAGDRHLRLLGRFARQIRFAGLLPEPPPADEWAAALRALAPHPTQPYDVVLAWDVLDRLGPHDRTALIERLALVTAPGARLYAVVDATGAPTSRPVRSTIVGLDRVSVEPIGPAAPARPQILPAHTEAVLAPFDITHAFMLRVGLREYVAVKPR